jgi:formylglycine-generating enzyme required for sulfatase activity
MHLDRSAFDSLFSRASQWPSDGNWDRVLRDTPEHLIEHLKTGMLLVLVPTGKFLTITGGYTSEVDLPAYYVGVHPVTNAQYARFVNETGHRKPELPTTGESVWKNGRFPPGMGDYPVVCVDLNDATAYCQWAGLRLPTELEWEKAARGLDGRAYPWGSVWDPKRCHKASATMFGVSHSVWMSRVWRYGRGGSPFGGLQLSGNVWEWCVASSSGSTCVARGGSWGDRPPDRFFASCRTCENHGYCSDFCGFRCVIGLNISS